MKLIDTSLRLPDVQGNILKGHGRKYSALVLFRFGPDARKNRAMLRRAADPEWNHRVTSAEEQQHQANNRRRWLTKSGRLHPAHQAAATEPFRSLGLTAAGVAACGLTRALGGEQPLSDDKFWSSAREIWESLRDPEPWQKSYRDDPHGVWLLANDDEALLKRMVKACRRMLRTETGGLVLGVEHGFNWTPYKKGKLANIGHEPFGFADGFARTRVAIERSSPLCGRVRHGSNQVRGARAKPFEIPLEQVLFEGRGPLAGGSLLVLRKLDQDVRGFLNAEAALQRQLKHLPADVCPVHAGALFVGRERDGTPLVRKGRKLADRFHFGGDQEAARCPFHAHIRKMNPRQNAWRDGSGSGMAERRNQKRAQFVRRGMVFGPLEKLSAKWKDRAKAPTGGVGLLFIGYMTSINGQFLQMHEAWAPEPSFPADEAGKDPFFQNATSEEWTWRQRSQLGSVPLTRFVTAKGAAYFLVPSVRWLRGLPDPVP